MEYWMNALVIGLGYAEPLRMITVYVSLDLSGINNITSFTSKALGQTGKCTGSGETPQWYKETKYFIIGLKKKKRLNL